MRCAMNKSWFCEPQANHENRPERCDGPAIEPRMKNGLVWRGIASSILMFLCCTPALAAVAGRIECRSLPSKVLAHAVNYCVVLPPSYDSDKTRKFPILYFFHGLGDNEQMFVH